MSAEEAISSSFFFFLLFPVQLLLLRATAVVPAAQGCLKIEEEICDWPVNGLLVAGGLIVTCCLI